MTKRLLWLGAGVAVGALVVRKLTRVKQAYSPAGMAGTVRESAIGAFTAVKDFVDDVREGMARREAQLREGFAGGIMLDDDFELDEDGGVGDEFAAAPGDELQAAGDEDREKAEDVYDEVTRAEVTKGEVVRGEVTKGDLARGEVTKDEVARGEVLKHEVAGEAGDGEGGDGEGDLGEGR